MHPSPRIPSTPASRGVTWCAAMYGLWQGAWILYDTPLRWSGPSYSVLVHMPGAPDIWGYSVAGFSLVLIAGLVTKHWGLKAVGCALLSVWSACFAVGAVGATLTHPNAGTTGGPTYLFIAVTLGVLIWYRDERPQGT